MNLSLYDYFCELADSAVPTLVYNGGDVLLWQQDVRCVVTEALGRLPERVTLQSKPVSGEERDGMVLERILVHSEQNVWVPVVLMRRRDLLQTRALPTLICLHGHGPYGKESLIGNARTIQERAVIEEYNYDYALRFAEEGFLTVSPDLRNFGQRGAINEYPGKDSCNVHFLRGLLFGVNLMAQNVWDVQRIVDYLSGREDVDADNIGCVGFSLGGTTALLAAAVEPRIAAAGIFSALSTYRTYAVKLGHFCGSQILPGILRYGDWPEVAGLIAPRPLYISHRDADPVFPIPVARQAYHYLQEIYANLGAASRLVMESQSGGHQFAMGHAPEFFARALAQD